MRGLRNSQSSMCSIGQPLQRSTRIPSENECAYFSNLPNDYFVRVIRKEDERVADGKVQGRYAHPQRVRFEVRQGDDSYDNGRPGAG